MTTKVTSETKKSIDLNGIPDVMYTVAMLEKFSDLLDALNSADDSIIDALPNRVKFILREMNKKDYPKTLAKLRVGLKRWNRGYGEKVWNMINEIIDNHDEVEVTY